MSNHHHGSRFQPFDFRTLRTPKTKHIKAAFDREVLARVCEMPERDFAEAYEMVTVEIPERQNGRFTSDDDFYHFKDNGSKILAVAHLDTVGADDTRAAHYVETEAGLVVFSRALDDRLGAYTILELLPKLGINVDVLLTVGEESGRSTAEFFEPDKVYDWMIEFDRGGTDVVMYQYHDDATEDLVEATGVRVGRGSFSDVAYLEHLGIKGFNWGIGYTGDYHGPRAHAFLEDTFEMVGYFLRFHETNKNTYLPHIPRKGRASDDLWWRGQGGDWADDVCDDFTPDPVDETVCITCWYHQDEHVEVHDGDLIAEYPSLAQITSMLDTDKEARA